jgi:hypothetical protein
LKEGFPTDALIRRFLLGDVDEEEHERIERRFISDHDVYDKIVVIEDELIEDYIEDSLTASDREKFLAQYGHTPKERRRLRIVKAIKEHAVAEATVSRKPKSIQPRWLNVISALRLRDPGFLIPVAAILVIAFVVGLVWLMDIRNKREQETNRRVAIERELADLNAPANVGAVMPQTVSLVLAPVSARSVGPQTDLRARTDIRVLELQLLWTQREQYSSYQAVLRRVGDSRQLTLPNLHVQKTTGGTAVPLKLPAHILTRGLYQITLNGIGSSGAPGQAEEYSFTVSD